MKRRQSYQVFLDNHLPELLQTNFGQLGLKSLRYAESLEPGQHSARGICLPADLAVEKPGQTHTNFWTNSKREHLH